MKPTLQHTKTSEGESRYHLHLSYLTPAELVFLTYVFGGVGGGYWADGPCEMRTLLSSVWDLLNPVRDKIVGEGWADEPMDPVERSMQLKDYVTLADLIPKPRQEGERGRAIGDRVLYGGILWTIDGIDCEVYMIRPANQPDLPTVTVRQDDVTDPTSL